MSQEDLAHQKAMSRVGVICRRHCMRWCVNIYETGIVARQVLCILPLYILLGVDCSCVKKFFVNLRYILPFQSKYLLLFSQSRIPTNPAHPAWKLRGGGVLRGPVCLRGVPGRTRVGAGPARRCARGIRAPGCAEAPPALDAARTLHHAVPGPQRAVLFTGCSRRSVSCEFFFRKINSIHNI